MTPHDHTTIVPGCFRCELGQDEVPVKPEGAQTCDECGDWTDKPTTPAEACTIDWGWVMGPEGELVCPECQ